MRIGKRERKRMIERKISIDFFYCQLQQWWWWPEEVSREKRWEEECDETVVVTSKEGK